MGLVYNNEKISTEIYGLDRLLFDGLQLQNIDGLQIQKPLTVVICGEKGVSKALLGMQCLHGLTKSLRCLSSKGKDGLALSDSIFYTACRSEKNLSDMLLDMLISKCTNYLIEEGVRGADTWRGCQFSSAIFEIEDNNRKYSLDCSILDQYISGEAIIYNNRTNSLHLATPSKYYSEDHSNEVGCWIAKRKYDSIIKYSNDPEIGKLKELSEEFFKIHIFKELEFSTDWVTVLENYPDLPDTKKIPCLLIDENCLHPMLDFLKNKSLVVIHLVDDPKAVDVYNPDLIIEMRSHEDMANGYQMHQLRINKSVLQNTALGWHQYKKRDYGIEVYPSSHVLLQRRRHMPKGVLRAHLDVLSETYQQSLSECPHGQKIDYVDFQHKKNDKRGDKLRKLHNSLQQEETADNVLKKIFLSPTKNAIESGEEQEKERGQVTAIIGEANTYKRFLTLGGTFGACCREEHTLNVLLDKDASIMLKRIVCPAMANKSNEAFTNNFNHCLKCYAYIHFMEIRMGCISSEEFFYYLMKQIRVSYEAKETTKDGSSLRSRQIKRVIIDDLQKIDYCFPSMKKDNLFLTALISICKDYGVDLFILCDKSSSLSAELRVQADNVICTKREDNNVRFFIERYSDYSNPSRILGCHTSSVKELFRCDTDKGRKEYYFNDSCINNVTVFSMDDFWVCNDTNKIVNAFKKI